MVDEEADYIDSVKDNTVDSFDIDTTTTVIRLTDGSLVLHSPAQATGSLIFEIARLGSTVSAIIAPNLQHWLGCASWAALFPQVRPRPPSHFSLTKSSCPGQGLRSA